MKFARVICLLLSLCLVFSACSATSSNQSASTSEQETTTSNEIQLTTENASNYLTFEIKGGGAGTDYSSMYGIGYEGVTVNGTITGVSGYTYNNVTITMNFKFTYENWGGGRDYTGGDYTQTITEDVVLNAGGNGTVSASEKIQLEPYHYVGHWSNVECLGYEIVSASGTVTQN